MRSCTKLAITFGTSSLMVLFVAYMRNGSGRVETDKDSLVIVHKVNE